MNPYLNLVGLFILGAVVLAGNLIVTLFWKTMADRHGDPRVVAFAQRTITVAEYLFTLTGTLLVAGAALAITLLHSIDFSTLWVQIAAGVFGLGVAIWLLLLVPLQSKQARAARVFATGGAVPDSYRDSCRAWYRLKLLQILLVLGFLAVVIFKPI